MKRPIIVLILALFPFFCFLQMNSLNSISHFLANRSDLYLGALSSAYVFGDALWLIPAGLIMDRINPIKIVLVSFLGYLAMLFVFSSFRSHEVLILSRFLMGCFHAFALLSCLKLISSYIPAQHKTLLISLAVTIALLGGLVAQTPLFFLIEKFGLSIALTINWFFGVIIFLTICVVYRFSFSSTPFYIDRKVENAKVSHSIYYALKKKNTWYAASYVSILSLPLMILGSVWGIDYLVSINHVPAAQASYLSTMIFLGLIIGGPLVGLISYKITFKKLLRCGAIGTFIALLLVILSTNFPAIFYGPLFFSLGLISSCQVLGYTLMGQAANQALAGVSIGVANALVMFFTASCQLIFSLLIQAKLAVNLFYLKDYFIGFIFIIGLFVFVIGATLRYTKNITNSF